ncbi:acyltransferase family protein [Pseudomonas sp. 10S4]|uniref:acyltransferase family protein n=1 Tax=Pseudomonas sp. 10S4 TaxID=3048583 RepID=UPI002AC8F8F6|nr:MULTISPECIES: acyltransferase [unclassified Pseudomonas]MEB0224701.1 acyltransferase [Pseudomonas sp. 5S1]MEB0295845.1 acyltransferase [Pseudomonas sp. 10S4]WPX18452.1 acyltransferase [Pseudomonas sp. 10S4]
MNSSATATNRSFGLDVCRTLACLLVVFGHMLGHSLPNPILQSFAFLAIFGVDLFFCLSGFLIGRILLKEAAHWGEMRTIGLTGFWYRRWMRTLPLYVFYFFISLRFDWKGATTFAEQFQYLVFAQNFAWPMTDFYRLSWSLAVEEWFYYAFPLALLLMIGLGAGVKRAATFTIGLFIVVPFLARLGISIGTDRYDDARYIVLFRLDAIGGGVAIAYLYTWHRSLFDRLIKYWYIPLAFVAAIIVLTKQGWPWTVNNKAVLTLFFTCSAIFFAALVPAFFNLRPSRWTLVNRFVKFTSLISYSIYLGHIFAFILVIAVINRFGLHESVYNNPWLVYPIFMACVYALAYMTYLFVEKPFLKLRDYNGFSLFKLMKSLQRLGAGK